MTERSSHRSPIACSLFSPEQLQRCAGGSQGELCHGLGSVSNLHHADDIVCARSPAVSLVALFQSAEAGQAIKTSRMWRLIGHGDLFILSHFKLEFKLLNSSCTTTFVIIAYFFKPLTLLVVSIDSCYIPHAHLVHAFEFTQLKTNCYLIGIC